MNQELKNDLIATKWEVDNSLELIFEEDNLNDAEVLGKLTERLANAKMWLDKHIHIELIIT